MSWETLQNSATPRNKADVSYTVTGSTGHDPRLRMTFAVSLIKRLKWTVPQLVRIDIDRSARMLRLMPVLRGGNGTIQRRDAKKDSKRLGLNKSWRGELTEFFPLPSVVGPVELTVIEVGSDGLVIGAVPSTEGAGS